MSEAEDNEPAPMRLTAVTMSDWPPLGGEVRLEVAPRCTVLVGKNGAGKSVLLEGILRGLHLSEPDEVNAGLGQFRFEVAEGTHRWVSELSYALPPPDDEEAPTLTEYPDPPVVWRDGARMSTADGESMPLDHFLERTLLVPASVPRDRIRSPALIPLRLDRRLKRPVPRPIPHRASRLAAWIYNMQQWAKDVFDEYVAVCQRVGLLSSLECKVYPSPDRRQTGGEGDIAVVSVDRVDLGLLSDGTLRVMEILRALIGRRLGVLLIEEPELALHPGLLGRLLKEIDAYAEGRQIILSTHSPQVVSWARPDEIRLVERKDGKTSVRSLSEAEVARVVPYLNDEGTLADFIYGGGVDE